MYKIDDILISSSGINFKHITELMKNGICFDSATGRNFYSGYIDKILFDWDQYFEAIIQFYAGWDSTLIKNGILIFLDNENESGLITRSVPVLPPNDNEHCKPFLSQIINLIRFVYKDEKWLNEEVYQKLKKYIDFWLNNMDVNKNGLCEWMSSVHTGMDNQHERAGYWNDRFCEGVDLNSYLYLELIAFSKIANYLGFVDDSQLYLEKALLVKNKIINEMWDESDGFFYDIDIRTNQMIKIKSISSFMPLWACIATKEQAKILIYEHLFNSKEFWAPYPISAYARSEKGYRTELIPSDIGCNWRANTWINTNYMIYNGLKFYGYNQLASLLAYKTYELVKKTGEYEYYNSENGEGIKQNPFWGWTLLAHFLPLEEKLDFNINLAIRGEYE